MTNEEAKKIIFNQWQAFLDNYIDYAGVSEAYTLAIKALDQEPAEKVGHWVKTIGENGVTSSVRCSECGFEDNRYMLFRYCPNCGAKMEEKG